ncbi:MAG TPA: DEAD/DEAH box helicase [Gemmatimonadales bacterium]|nr:DEAD/DEAH box helicase [Gemmatimonadales bacterium]
MAEALSEVHDPLATVLSVAPTDAAREVAETLAASVAPPEASYTPPPWLRGEQRGSFRRALAALEIHRGVVLADPVGSGKTYIALAAAMALGAPTVAIVPAALASQWRHAANRVALPLALLSHEAVSRGHLPASDRRLVIVDESHRFRNPATRRYRALAPWLHGRRVLLLSATPVVNQLSDLAHQLLLAVRDDALSGRGCPSLLEALRARSAPSALGDLVICRPLPAGAPAVRSRAMPVSLDPQCHELLELLDRLRLSRDPTVAGLIRSVFWRACASSPGALLGVLERYARLLDHADAAREAGQSPTRAAIRSFVGRDPEQLVLWGLAPIPDEPVDLALDDASRLRSVLDKARRAAPEADGKCRLLADLIGDGTPTLVFTGFRDTLTWLRARLSRHGPAWVTGDAAGIGRSRLGRDAVLDWFRPGAMPRCGTPPALLLATDVAAEGLDLQRVSRVVHYDLPWTAVRLDQRVGRAARLGSLHESIEVIEFSAASELERRLHQLESLGIKRELLLHAGLDQRSRWLYRWRSDMAVWARPCPGIPGMTVVKGEEEGWLIGLALDLLGPTPEARPEPGRIFWVDNEGCRTEDPKKVVPILETARESRGRAPAPEEHHAALDLAAGIAREELRLANTERWSGHLEHDQRLLVARLRRLARLAACRRDGRLLSLIDQSLAWLCGGLTAGEAHLVGRLLHTPTNDLASGLRTLLTVPRGQALFRPRVTGVVRVSSLPRCLPSAPFSSISMEP